MATNSYECLFILDSNRYARDPGAVGAQIGEMIEASGGKVLASRLWVEQKLAYPINGQRKGTYWLAYFEMASEKVTEFNRACQLNDNVLRNLTLQVDPRLVDALVRHVGGVVEDEPEDAAGETDGEAKDGEAKDGEAKDGEAKGDATDATDATAASSA